MIVELNSFVNKNDVSHIRTYTAQSISHDCAERYYYAYFSAENFQETFAYTTEKEILNNYELFSLENFCAYARRLASYDDFILSLETKIKQDKQFKRKTAYIPGFAYHFGMRGEKSGFHDFVMNEADIIRKNQTQRKSIAQKGILHIHDICMLDQLNQQWSLRKKNAVDSKRLDARLNALNKVRIAHGLELDEQLYNELSETGNVMKGLEHIFGDKHHVQVLAPIVYHRLAQAQRERNPIVAFGLSDFCYTITQVLSHGMHVLYDVSYAIGKGICRSIQTVTSSEHWKDMATGMLHMGLLCAQAIGHEEDFHYAAALARFSEQSDVLVNFSEKYCTYTQAQKDAINYCAQQTYQKIKSMSWQELLENGTEIGTTMILDTMALHAFSTFTKVTSNIVIKQMSQTVESGFLLQEGYAAEVAGFGKLVIEESAEIAAKAVDVIENNMTFFLDNKSIFKVGSEIGNIACDINNIFKPLIKSAMVLLKGSNTCAGRAFQKHAARGGSAFIGEITGDAVKNTRQAMNYINMIIKSPNSAFVIRNTKSYGDVLDVRLPDGMGARWTSDGGKFIGFLERYTMK